MIVKERSHLLVFYLNKAPGKLLTRAGDLRCYSVLLVEIMLIAPQIAGLYSAAALVLLENQLSSDTCPRTEFVYKSWFS